VTPGPCGNGRPPGPAGGPPAWQTCRPLGTEPPAGDGVVIVMGSSSGELLARKEEPGTAAVPVTRITFGWFAGSALPTDRRGRPERLLLRHGFAVALEFCRLVQALEPPAPVRCIIAVNDTNGTFRFHHIPP